MPLFGYVRTAVRAPQEAAQAQRTALEAAGVSSNNIVEEAAGAKGPLPSLNATIGALTPGDILIVQSLNRLGGDLRSIVKIMSALAERSAHLRVLEGTGRSLSTTEEGGETVFAVIEALKEFDERLVSEKQSEGAVAGNARGHRGGKPTKMTPATIRAAAQAMADPNTNVGELCRSLGIARQTLYRFVGPKGELKDHAKQLLAREKTGRTQTRPAA